MINLAILNWFQFTRTWTFGYLNKTTPINVRYGLSCPGQLKRIVAVAQAPAERTTDWGVLMNRFKHAAILRLLEHSNVPQGNMRGIDIIPRRRIHRLRFFVHRSSCVLGSSIATGSCRPSCHPRRLVTRRIVPPWCSHPRT